MAGNAKSVVLDWKGGLVFEGGEAGGPSAVVDATNDRAPGPMLQVLMALVACTGSDVVSILEKMKVDLETCRIEARGVRREEHPRRYLTIHLDYHVKGGGLDETKARRAIDLSLEKYCSVTHSLRLDEPVSYELHLG